MGPQIGRRAGVMRDVHALFEAHPDVWMGTAEVTELVRAKRASACNALFFLHAEGALVKEVVAGRRVRYKLATTGETT